MRLKLHLPASFGAHGCTSVRRRTWRGRLLAAAIAGLGAVACIDLSTDPDEIVSIEFPPFAMPAVVAGDTLRDVAGIAVPLLARLYTASGEIATDAPVTFLTLDTTLITITSTGYLVARVDAEGTARLIASAAGLQSPQRPIDIVPRPDTLTRDGAIDTLRFVIPDNATTNISSPVRVKVQSQTATLLKPVKSWVVTFALRFRNVDIALTDTSLIWLVNDAGRPSYADTTDATGIASRRVRFRAQPGQVTPLDSAIVFAQTRYRGSLVKPGTLRMVVPLKPR